MNANTIEPTPQDERAAIEAFEADTGYDGSYMKAMLQAAPEAFRVFQGFLPMAGHRKTAPLLPYYVAKLAAYRHCDCGPCLQLALEYARREGVPKEIRAAVVLDEGELEPSLQRVRDFALAALRNEPECDRLRRALEAELGKPALVELALAIAAPQIFPVVKRAMGYYRSCTATRISA